MRDESSSSLQSFDDASSSVLHGTGNAEGFLDDSGGGDVPNKMSSAPNTQVSTNSGRRGPLERFTLMIGENILHFRIVKAPVEAKLS
ncbi:hypothetical protein KIN20_007537 [Parelaphostrongylus tenuis]|uniref:Uncharacterized protein n=1 Tax=Parelaphostrongylus tenuis TaxID=148309 RepID=A0AAD5MLL4_PARTN|nr:hypothetical protein KIN20_007537 [Parelaphostrongylus tenuis]